MIDCMPKNLSDKCSIIIDTSYILCIFRLIWHHSSLKLSNVLMNLKNVPNMSLSILFEKQNIWQHIYEMKLDSWLNNYLIIVEEL